MTEFIPPIQDMDTAPCEPELEAWIKFIAVFLLAFLVHEISHAPSVCEIGSGGCHNPIHLPAGANQFQTQR